MRLRHAAEKEAGGADWGSALVRPDLVVATAAASLESTTGLTSAHTAGRRTTISGSICGRHIAQTWPDPG